MRAENGRKLTRRGTVVGVFAVAGMMAAGPAVGAPTGANPVASLINQIADVDQSLTDLADDVAAKQENVNKALVDFQNAVAARQLAASANTGAKRSLDEVSEEVERAQADFDDFIRSVYRQGDSQGTMTEYLASDDPDKVLEKLTAVDQVTHQQQRVIRRLQVARNQQANRVAATEVAKRQTAAAAENAGARRNDAVAAFQAAQTAVREQEATRSELVKQRDRLAARLAELRGKPAAAPTTTEPGPAPLIPGVPPEVSEGLHDAIDAIPKRPVAGDDLFAQAAAAAAKLAVDTGQALLASLVGQQQIPHSALLDELGIGGTSPFADGEDNTFVRIGNGSLGSLFSGMNSAPGQMNPGLRGPQAVELVINRMMSQLGVPYAWGGGDANGPTLGIRDYGVADQYGDYQKVGFDCSGLMIYGFAGVGIDLPHYTGYQYDYDKNARVPLAEMRRGDMIFYGPSASQHVAMILGDGTMLEAPQSGDVVKISPVRTAGAMPSVVRLL